MSDEKRHVYLPKEFADKIESLSGDAALNAAIEEHFADVRGDIKASLESLDDFALHYKGISAKARLVFKAATEEVLEKSYAEWEIFDDSIPNLEEKVQRSLQVIAPLKRDLKEINDLFNNVNSYGIEKLIKMIDQISQANPETKAMIKFLMDSYKREN